MDSVDLTQNTEKMLLAIALAVLRFGHKSILSGLYFGRMLSLLLEHTSGSRSALASSMGLSHTTYYTMC